MTNELPEIRVSTSDESIGLCPRQAIQVDTTDVFELFDKDGRVTARE